MSKSIAKNFLYNLMLQIVTLFMPLITVPYVSRILGKEGVGVYSYTLSIVQYFVILGTLGISMYGNRQIAYVRDDKEKMSKTFWSIISLNFISTGIAFIIFIVLFGTDKIYSSIYLIQSINIIAAMIDISWLYMGLEDFKKTVTRNLVVKIIGVICIFIFVKDYTDIYLYTFINAMMVLIGNLVMWIYIPKTVLISRISIQDIKLHLLPSIQLFLPQVAIQIYSVLDKTMLGKLSNVSQVGIYEQSQKIIRMTLGLVTSLGLVMLPRMSNLYSIGDKEQMKVYLNKSLNLVAYASIPMSIGLASISLEFVPWFFGDEFYFVSYIMILLSPILVFIAIGTVLGNQYLLPSNRIKEFTLAVSMGSVFNIVLNFLLIPKYKALGAAISTLISEFLVMSIQYFMVRKDIESKLLFINISKYIFSALIMSIIVRVVGITMKSSIATTICQSMVGVLIYITVLIMVKDKITIKALGYVKSRLKKKMLIDLK